MLIFAYIHFPSLKDNLKDHCLITVTLQDKQKLPTLSVSECGLSGVHHTYAEFLLPTDVTPLLRISY